MSGEEHGNDEQLAPYQEAVDAVAAEIVALHDEEVSPEQQAKLAEATGRWQHALHERAYAEQKLQSA